LARAFLAGVALGRAGFLGLEVSMTDDSPWRAICQKQILASFRCG
jgi:hypothetical protein